MRKPTIRRLIAYIIDMIIVGLIASALSSVHFFNPYLDKYNEAQDSYQALVDEVSEDTTKINDLLNNDELADMTYQISKSGVFVTIYTVVISFLYFVVFQYYTKGKTLGKKILKIEVVSNDKKELQFKELFKRSIIINSLVTSTISIILIMALSKANYMNYNRYVQLVDALLVLGSCGLILYREDGRGFHDLFGGTRVIMSADKEFFLKHDEVKEVQIVTEEKPTKKRTTKKKEL